LDNMSTGHCLVSMVFRVLCSDLHRSHSSLKFVGATAATHLAGPEAMFLMFQHWGLWSLTTGGEKGRGQAKRKYVYLGYITAIIAYFKLSDRAPEYAPFGWSSLRYVTLLKMLDATKRHSLGSINPLRHLCVKFGK
jgi:hypothetical protein